MFLDERKICVRPSMRLETISQKVSVDRRGQRSLRVFAAYERRNDVYPLVPELRNRVLLGLRFGIVDKSE